MEEPIVASTVRRSARAHTRRRNTARWAGWGVTFVLATLALLPAPPADAGWIVNQGSPYAVRAYKDACWTSPRVRHILFFPCKSQGPNVVLQPGDYTRVGEDWDYVRILKGYYAEFLVSPVYNGYFGRTQFRVTAHSGKDVYVRAYDPEILYIKKHGRIPR